MSDLDPAAPFSLRLPKEERVHGPRHVSSTRHHIRGFARLEGAGLVLEWSGTIERSVVQWAEVWTERVPVPVSRATIPVRQVRRIELRGGWWRPRIDLRTSDLGSLASVPGAAPDHVSLWLARRDRRAAAELVAATEAAIADAMLRAVEAHAALPNPPTRLPG
jgi:hypothetical protein